MQHRPIRVIRIIDRLNIGGPAKHVVWLTAGLDGETSRRRLSPGRFQPGKVTCVTLLMRLASHRW